MLKKAVFGANGNLACHFWGFDFVHTVGLVSLTFSAR